MTTRPTYEVNYKVDNVQISETIEAPQVLHDSEPPRETQKQEIENNRVAAKPNI